MGKPETVDATEEKKETTSEATAPVAQPGTGTSLRAKRKKSDYITPSGVRVGLLSLMGAHQRMITTNDSDVRRAGINEMLWDCIEYWGDDRKKPDLKDIQLILEEDRTAMLFEMRMLSNKRNQRFKFKYEFPLKNKQKRTVIEEVDFNTKKFPFVPFLWVREKMEEDYKVKHVIPADDDLDSMQHEECYTETITMGEGEDEIKIDRARAFPVIYGSYQEMLDKNYNQETILPECNVKVTWQLLDVKESEKHAYSGDKSKQSSHTILTMRKPKYEMRLPNQTKAVIAAVTLDVLSLVDIEHLREHIREIEGDIDTSTVIQYKEDAGEQQQVNLVAVPAFFFPSLAV